MDKHLTLTALTEAVSDAVHFYFEDKILKIKAEITDVKKYPQKRWCFLKFVEKAGENIIAEMRGVVWNNGYAAIQKLEQATGQKFESGIEIICDVQVKYHSKFGLSLEICDIDVSHTIGSLEIERQKTINRLLAEFPQWIREIDGEFFTFNNNITLPTVVQRLALITAPDSDGQRDFLNEMHHNPYGYKFRTDQYLCTIQGDTAAALIVEQFQKIKKSKTHYDAIVLIRGGGSATDFKPFDSFEVAKTIASFTVPVLTGIGHDRNTSIADLMARQFKTPTKVATFIVEQALFFESKTEELMMKMHNAVKLYFSSVRQQLQYISKTIELSDPSNILKKGFAMIAHQGKIISNTETLSAGENIQTILYKSTITSTINKIDNNE